MTVMKKLFNYIPLLGVALLAACETDIDKTIFNAGNAEGAVLETPANTVLVLDSKQQDNTILTLNWTAPDFGYQAMVTNSIELDVAGNNFATARTLATAVANATTQDLTVATLNSNILGILQDNGIEGDFSARDFELRLASHISEAADTLYSNVLTLNITPYDADIQYPEMFIIGEYCGWSGENPQTQNLFSFSQDEVNYEGLIDFNDKAANGFKITDAAPNSDWSNCKFNCGLDGAAGAPAAEAASITLLNNGGSSNIACYSKRYYRFTFNKETLELGMNLSFDKIYLVGSAEGLTWDTSKAENEMNFDPATQRFYIDYTFAAGNEIKFLTDGNLWLGITKEGKVGDGDNIVISEAGSYRIYLNLNDSNNQAYELNAEDFGL